MSRKTYWLFSILIIAGYGALWLYSFPDYYGWQADDWMTFRKALATVHDWKSAFTVRINLLQPYFFLYSYLPVAFGPDLPSISFPIYGPEVGRFRFLALFTIFFHIATLILWVALAKRLVESRTVAFVSLVIFVASPELALWMPQNETRLVVLLPIFLGLLALEGVGHSFDRTTCVRYAVTGLAFSVAQSLHYTAFYFIIPYCAVRLLLEWRYLGLNRRLVTVWASFGVGAVILPVILEVVSLLWAAVPFAKGPLASMLTQNEGHTVQGADRWRLVGRFALDYGMYSLILFGPVAIVLFCVGSWRTFKSSQSLPPRERINIHALLGTVLLGLIWIVTSPTFPGTRKMAPLFPFIALFTAVGVVRLADWAFQRDFLRVRAAAVAIAALLTVAQPSVFAHEAYRSHFGLGPALRKAHELANAGGGRILWLATRVVEYSPYELLRTANPDDIVVVDYPYELLGRYPGLLHVFRDTKPEFVGVRPWSTYIVRANFARYWGIDFSKAPVLTNALVFRASELQRTMDAQQRTFITDATAGHTDVELANLLFNRSYGTARHWKANGTGTIEIEFAYPIDLGAVELLGEVYKPHGTSISNASIEVSPLPSGDYRVVFAGPNSRRDIAFRPQWKPQKVRRMRITLTGGRKYTFGNTKDVKLDQIRFPGFDARYAWRPEVPVGRQIHLGEAALLDLSGQYGRSLMGNLGDTIDPNDGVKVAVSVPDLPPVFEEKLYINGIPVPTRVNHCWENDIADGNEFRRQAENCSKFVAALVPPDLIRQSRSENNGRAVFQINLRDDYGRIISNTSRLELPPG